MNNYTAITDDLRSGRYEDAEHKSAALVQQDPLAAQGWVFLGEALLRQGQGLAARAVFNRASLLDPQASWIDAVQKALAKAPQGNSRPDIASLLRFKEHHVSVAAAIMTFNEERSIQRCILSLLEAVDEIIVLDSASTDKTLDIVAQFPQVKIIKNVCLEDDFAAKRNKGLEHIDSDWVLWVDADEWLDAEDKAAVREAAYCFHHSPLPPALNLCLINHVSDRKLEDLSSARMFPLRRGLRYYGRVHEQLIRADQDVFGSDILRRAVRIRLHHDGYQPEIVQSKDKLKRNIRLLQRMIEDDPDNPGWWLYYGRETLNSGDSDLALEILLEAERRAVSEDRFGRLTEIHWLLTDIYVSRQQYDDAEAVCIRSLDHKPDFPNMLYQLAQIQMRKAALLLKQAESALRQTKQAFHTYRGAVPADRDIRDWKADVALADLARLSGNIAQAESIYRAVLARRPDLDNVRKRLEK